MSALLARSLPLLLAAAVTAQVPVVVRGEPTDGSAAGCYYCTGYEHVIKHVGTRMQSTAVNLLAYHGQDTELRGTWNGTTFVVTSVQIVEQSFSISGNGNPGGEFKCSSLGEEGDAAINLLALGAAFSVPFADLAMQLDPASLMLLGIGAIDAGGEFETRIAIPDLPSLIGLRVFGQGAIFPQVGAPFSTSVDVREVRAAG